jgi:hypothetical protein
MFQRHFTCIIVALFISVTCLAQIPEIREPITNGFGTYRPNLVSVSPDALQFSLRHDLENVENADRFMLDDNQIELLVRNGFFISTGHGVQYTSGSNTIGSESAEHYYKNFEDVYLEAQQDTIPSFITTDALLHAFHRLFSHTLMRTEEEYLIPTLVELDTALLAHLEQLHDGAETDEVREAARLAATYIAVGLRLQEPQAPVPGWCEPDLSAELELIEAHDIRTTSPLFNAYPEDYTQYVPRGHYTRSTALESYFRTMMWHGRMTFALREMADYRDYWDMPQRPDLTGAALLLSRELARDQSLADAWNLIFNPTWFFVGESDDLLPNHYLGLAEHVYGAPLVELTPAEICREELVQLFMDRAEEELPMPRVRGLAPQGLRMFGQRFTPDAYFFTELVWDDVGTQSYPRLCPSVLDVLSVLGSAEAEELQRIDGQEEFQHYREQLLMLREWVATQPVEIWASTLYWGWIYTLEALTREHGAGFPPFMQGSAWARRQLIDAAGSWTELRHDMILYVKQSANNPWTMPAPVFPMVQGYVEPNPWLFARLAALAGFARAGLSDLGILSDDTGAKLIMMEEGAMQLADMAVRELERRPLTNQQHLFIFHFGEWLSQLVAVDEEGGSETDNKDRAPVVADVHTMPINDELFALEEGTGYPGRIFVVADVEGRLQLCVGAVFIQYEFTVPAAERLTDEAWWELLEQGGLQTPWWTEGIIDSLQTPPAETQARQKIVELFDAEVYLDQTSVQVGDDLVLHCNPPALRVEMRTADGEVLDHEVGDNDGNQVVLSTEDLPVGELIIVAELEGDISYSLRARIDRAFSPRRVRGRRP